MGRRDRGPLRAWVPVSVLGLLACGMRAEAQTTLLVVDGLDTNDAFGTSVDGAGDVNGDGRADLVVGAPYAAAPAAWPGAAYVVSGVDGSLLLTLSLGAYAGTAVSGLGDVDGDGRGDVVVGAPRWGADAFDWCGRVSVHSGVDGSLIDDIVGSEFMGQLGVDVDGGGDRNGDGNPDVIGEALQSEGPFGATGPGYLVSFSPATNTGVPLGEKFAYAAAMVGDINANGTDDTLLAVGGEEAQIALYEGIAQVPTYVYDGFVSTLGPAGDADADGRADFAIGETFFIAAFGKVGRVRVFSGATGALLHEIIGEYDNGDFGRDIDCAGDVDGDGRDDVLIGGASRAFVCSGLDGGLLMELPVPGGGAIAVANAGDVDGDGREDLLLGAPSTDMVSPNAGRVTVISGVPVWTRLGGGIPGFLGQPRLTGIGTWAAGTFAILRLVRGLTDAPLTLVIGTEALFAPLKGGTLVPEPMLLAFSQVEANGLLNFVSVVPPGIPPGTEIFFQEWMVDAAAVQGYSATNGLKATTP